MAKSLPKLPKDRKLSEERFENPEGQDVVDIREEFIYEFLGREDGPMVLSGNLNERTRNAAIRIIEEKGLLTEYFLGFANRHAQTPGGVPQGSPLSPFLAILAIREYLEQQSHVNYADDQIFYGDKTFTIRDFPAMGILHNNDKSGWIKKDGV